MRVIVNIPSDAVTQAVGWRAKAIEISGKHEVGLEELFRMIKLIHGGSLYDLLIEGDHLKHDRILYVNGIRLTDYACLEVRLKDNVQVHIMDNPHPGTPETFRR